MSWKAVFFWLNTSWECRKFVKLTHFASFGTSCRELLHEYLQFIFRHADCFLVCRDYLIVPSNFGPYTRNLQTSNVCSWAGFLICKSRLVWSSLNYFFMYRLNSLFSAFGCGFDTWRITVQLSIFQLILSVVIINLTSASVNGNTHKVIFVICPYCPHKKYAYASESKQNNQNVT